MSAPHLGLDDEELASVLAPVLARHRHEQDELEAAIKRGRQEGKAALEVTAFARLASASGSGAGLAAAAEGKTPVDIALLAQLRGNGELDQVPQTQSALRAPIQWHRIPSSVRPPPPSRRD